MNRIVTISSTLFMLASGLITPQLADAQLEEIIVTATKREMNAQDTNLALTVIDENLLDSFDIQDVAGLGNQIPSLIFGKSSHRRSLPLIQNLLYIIFIDFGSRWHYRAHPHSQKR